MKTYAVGMKDTSNVCTDITDITDITEIHIMQEIHQWIDKRERREMVSQV